MKSKRFFFSCLTALLLPVLAADWPQWRGPNRDGVAPDTTPLRDALPESGLKPVWKTEPVKAGFDGGWSSPVIADGKVYLFVHQKLAKPDAKIPKRKFPWLPPDKRGHLSAKEYEEYEVNRRDEDEAIGRFYQYTETFHCFDAANGETLWSHEQPTLYTRFLQSGTPTVHDGKVYVLGAPKTLRCYNLDTRKPDWETEMPGEFRDEYFMSSVAVVDGVAIFVAGRLYGVDAATGEILWEGDPEKTSAIHASAVVWETGGETLVICNGGRTDTFCVEPRTGEERWRVESGANHSTPALVGGDTMLTFGASRKSGLRCYDITATEAKERWVYTGVADSGGSPIAVGGFAYATGDRKVACVDLESGEEQWKSYLALAKPRYTSLFAAGDQIFYPWGGLVAFRADPSEFKLLYEGKMNEDGLLATKAAHERRLGLADMEDKDRLRIYRDKIEKFGTVDCVNAAFADGKVVLRVRDGLVCYDLARP